VGLVKPGGVLFIAIYNDCGEVSRWVAAAEAPIHACRLFFRPLYAVLRLDSRRSSVAARLSARRGTRAYTPGADQPRPAGVG